MTYAASALVNGWRRRQRAASSGGAELRLRARSRVIVACGGCRAQDRNLRLECSGGDVCSSL